MFSAQQAALGDQGYSHRHDQVASPIATDLVHETFETRPVSSSGCRSFAGKMANLAIAHGLSHINFAIVSLFSVNMVAFDVEQCPGSSCC